MAHGLVPAAAAAAPEGEDLVPAGEQPEAGEPAGNILDGFGQYLRTERQLAGRTVRLRVYLVRPFLPGLAGPDGTVCLDQASPAMMARFVAGQSRVYAIGSVKQVTVALRSLLWYLFAAGLIDRDLSPSVPPVASWRMSGLPCGGEDGDVSAMLAGCDRSTVIGARGLRRAHADVPAGPAGLRGRQAAAG